MVTQDLASSWRKILAAPALAIIVSAAASAQSTGAAPGAAGGNIASPAAASTADLPLQHQAYVMMGHIEVADVALLNGFSDEAAGHVGKALAIARRLEGQTTKFNVDTLKAGHLRYSDASGLKHDYWLPLVNDHIVVDNLSESFGHGDKPAKAAEEAELVNVSVSIDTKIVLKDLEKASSALKAKDVAGAQAALDDAQRNVFSVETVQQAPIATVRDNLVLARELLKSQDYKAAGTALQHAKTALKDYQGTQKESGKADRAVKLQQQIDQLQSDLTKDDPSVLTKMRAEIDHWIESVKSL